MTNTTVEVRRADLRIGDLLGATKRLMTDRFLLMIGLAALVTVGYSLVPIILEGPLMVGLMICFRRAFQSKPVGVEQLMEGFGHAHFKESVITTLLLTAIRLLSMVLVLPAFLLMFFGASENNEGIMIFGMIVMAAIMFPIGAYLLVLSDFAFALVADQRADGVEAIKLAARGVSANLVGCLKLGIVAVGLIIAGELLCCVGVFAAIPIMHCMLWFAHHEVFGDVAPDLPDSTGPVAAGDPIDTQDQPWGSGTS